MEDPVEGLKRRETLGTVAAFMLGGGLLAVLLGGISITIGVGLSASAGEACEVISTTAEQRRCRVPAWWLGGAVLLLGTGAASALTGGLALWVLKMTRRRPS